MPLTNLYKLAQKRPFRESQASRQTEILNKIGFGVISGSLSDTNNIEIVVVR